MNQVVGSPVDLGGRFRASDLDRAPLLRVGISIEHPVKGIVTGLGVCPPVVMTV